MLKLSVNLPNRMSNNRINLTMYSIGKSIITNLRPVYPNQNEHHLLKTSIKREASDASTYCLSKFLKNMNNLNSVNLEFYFLVSLHEFSHGNFIPILKFAGKTVRELSQTCGWFLRRQSDYSDYRNFPVC